VGKKQRKASPVTISIKCINGHSAKPATGIRISAARQSCGQSGMAGLEGQQMAQAHQLGQIIRVKIGKGHERRQSPPSLYDIDIRKPGKPRGDFAIFVTHATRSFFA
jgi:hypothetical protein